jgi:uncharacterized membrane protein
MTVSTITEFLHVLATTTWIGGMIYTNAVLMPSISAINPQERGKLIGAVSKRFTLYAWGSIIILVITGFMATPSGLLFSTATTYGTTLTIKHVVVLVMIVVGLLITFVISPKLMSLAPSPGDKPSPDYLKTQGQLTLLARVNLVLGILVLLLAVML